MKLSGTTLQEAAGFLKQLRRYKPFKYGGRWYIFKIADQSYAVREFTTMQDKMRGAGLTYVEYIPFN